MRILRLAIVAMVIVLIGAVAYFVITHNQLGKPCPAGGCVKVLVSGDASLQGKEIGFVTKIQFNSSSGQVYTQQIGTNGGPSPYILTLPNNQNYTVTITSNNGSSCSAGTLDLKSNLQSISWNAYC